MKKYVLVFAVAAAVLVADQVSKAYIRQTVGLYESIAVVDSVFHITHVRNKGGAFSLFADTSSALRVPFFFAVTVVALGVLVFMVRRVEAKQFLLLFALGGILGGALGNFVDRLRFAGQVTDFLDFHWNGYYWPAFNVADSFITTGMIILLGYSLLVREERPHGAGDHQKA